MTFLRKLFFSWHYLGSPPWDTGITPPELAAFIAEHAAGRALDLGCGTGTNVLSLARAGWDASGVDFSGKAIRAARKKAGQAGLQASFFRDDVLRLKDVSGQFDLIVDIGCLHGLPPTRLLDYTHNIERLLAAGGTYLLYAFYREPGSSSAGVLQSELDAAFTGLELYQHETGTERGRRPSAWFWFKKPAD